MINQTNLGQCTYPKTKKNKNNLGQCAYFHKEERREETEGDYPSIHVFGCKG